MDNNMSSFYLLVIAELLAVFFAIAVHLCLHYDGTDHAETCPADQSSYEETFRIAVTAITVPLGAEYLLDALVTFCYPSLRETHAFEDRVGHGIILFSLLPSSHLPFWIVGDSILCSFKDCFIGLSHSMIVCGVLGKLQNFASDIWSFNECVLVMTLFICAQLCFICGNLQRSVTEYHELALIVACGLKTCSLVAFLSSSRNIHNLLSEKTTFHSFFTTRKYFCTILCFGLVIFLAICTLFSNYILYKHQTNMDITGSRILILICAVLLLTVLPARIIRRGITALENSTAIEREMTMKKTFVRYVSHEVRSPLSTTSLGIDCLINLLKTMPNSKLRRELTDLAQDCRITCSSAISTLNDLLLFDKIESNMLHIDKEKILCKTFLQDCVRPFIRQLELSNIKLDISFDPQVTGAYLNGDPNKLEQVIRNFITNAVKFTPVNGKISVIVGISTNGKIDTIDGSKVGMLKLSVVDTGAGISFENQKKLFQQYVQFNAGKLQGGKGSGLGLWISKAIIDMHDGRVGAYSAGEGKGSTFYFELPCHVVPESIVAETFKLETNKIENKCTLAPICIPEDPEKTKDTPMVIDADLSRTVSTVVAGYSDTLSTTATEGKTSESSNSFPESTTSISTGSAFSNTVGSPRSFVVLSENFSSSNTKINRSFSSTSGDASFFENTSKRLKILLADDTALTRKMVQRMLAPLDPIVCHASNGVEAVNMVLQSMQPEERMFDVVIIDYYMPGMDGAEAVLSIRNNHFDGLICAVTGSTTPTDQERLIQNGASMIMGKPFNYKAFYDCLREFYHNVDWDPQAVIPYVE